MTGRFLHDAPIHNRAKQGPTVYSVYRKMPQGVMPFSVLKGYAESLAAYSLLSLLKPFASESGFNHITVTAIQLGIRAEKSAFSFH